MFVEFALVLPVFAMFGCAVFWMKREVARVDDAMNRLQARLMRIYAAETLPQLVADRETGVYFPVNQKAARLETLELRALPRG